MWRSSSEKDRRTVEKSMNKHRVRCKYLLVDATIRPQQFNFLVLITGCMDRSADKLNTNSHGTSALVRTG